MEEAGHWPVRLTTVSPTEYLQQTVQEHCLAFQDLKSRLGNAKPECAVELRKRLSTPRPRRPFHVEHVAPKIGWVPILFNCPHMDDLAARLLGTAKRNGFAARTVTVSSANSRCAAESGDSPGPIRPFGMVQAP